MNKRNDWGKGRLLFDLLLVVVAIYLFFIAYRHPQEAKDALVLAFLCMGAVVYLEIWARFKGILHTILSVVLIMGITVFMSCELCIAVGAREHIPKVLCDVDYILVLGNKLESFELSDTLKARLDKAVELSGYLDVPIIVSGGNSGEHRLSEASIMRKYLHSQDVQNEILLEEKAINTRQNLLYASELTGTESTLVIITSELHLFRVKMLSKDMGFEHVYGIGTSTDGEMYLYYNLREVVAILREILMSLLRNY